MKRSDIIKAFVAGFLAAQRGEKDCLKALAKHETSIPKRIRRWHKKPEVLNLDLNLDPNPIL